MNVLSAVKRSFGGIYRYIFKGPVFLWVAKILPFLRPIYYTRGNESPATFNMWFIQKVLGFNRHCYWPVHHTSTVRFPRNVFVGIDAAPGISPGCHIQAVGKVYIDDYTQIAPNVGIISSNHFMLDIRQHVKDVVRIGKYCRVGMGSIIHPGVVLGDFTTVAAGAVVTKSFPAGYCVISGNPAKITVDYSKNEGIKEKFVRYTNQHEYNGYIPHEKFEAFRLSKLDV
jgi:acetyltransferase-like isoleucine patch superfamily enzyme